MRRAAIEEQNRYLLKRQRELRMAADVVTDAFATFPEVREHEARSKYSGPSALTWVKICAASCHIMLRSFSSQRKMPRQFQRHFSRSADIEATPREIFAHLDDHARLSGHMTRSSWMMGGGRMDLSMDEGGGARVGSHIRLSGRAFGLFVALDEVVTTYEPPASKVWETVGEPKLLVIGAYRMGFAIEHDAAPAKLRVFIDYDLPASGFARILGFLLGGLYASWCVKSMLSDAAAHFRMPTPTAGRTSPGTQNSA
jgi:hypothetical protein